MSAEPLIALEAAVSELGGLYTAARDFVSLRDAAEHELLPRLLELGRRLRALLRAARLTEREIDDAARDIVALRSEWEAKLQEVHESPLYRRALDAIAANRQKDLPELLPKLLSGLHVLHPTPLLFFPVSVSSGRRRPGTSPFLDVGDLVGRLVDAMDQGLCAEQSLEGGWESDLPSLACALEPHTLDTPVSLQLQPGAANAAGLHVFERSETFAHFVFTKHLLAPLSVVLAAEATDSWWETNELPYPEFRDDIAAELRRRGRTVAVVPG